ncbi:RAB44 protein, partial [Cercotrichas coryphoeus]|nr:RAB44 protein [Cercotrichas coryphoeus]
AVTAGGAGAAPRGCPKAPLEPEHLYNVLFVGDSHVGKTSFLYRLHADAFSPHLTATVGTSAPAPLEHLLGSWLQFPFPTPQAAGAHHVLVTAHAKRVEPPVPRGRAEPNCPDLSFFLTQEAAEDGVAVLLLGNKTDCAAQRQVPTKEGECLAKEHQLMFYECSAASGHNVLESMVSFTRLLKSREDELKNKAEEVPKAPQKKKGCCW